MKFAGLFFVLVSGLFAQQSQLTYSYMDAEACTRMQSYIPISSPCVQRVMVIAYGNSNVSAYRITISYTDSSGNEHSQSLVSSVGPENVDYSAVATFSNVDNITLESIIADPLVYSGGSVSLKLQ